MRVQAQKATNLYSTSANSTIAEAEEEASSSSSLGAVAVAAAAVHSEVEAARTAHDYAHEMEFGMKPAGDD